MRYAIIVLTLLAVLASPRSAASDVTGNTFLEVCEKELVCSAYAMGWRDAFASVLAGGILFDTTGSYTLIWQIAIGLGLVAAILHLPINEAPVTEPVAQPAE